MRQMTGFLTTGESTKSAGRHWPVVVINVLLLTTLCIGQLVRAETQHDFLVFGSLEAFDMMSDYDPDLDGLDGRAMADILYTLNSDRFRFLAEYVWSDDESELERLQAAWIVDEQTMLWFGRFHAISNFWTTEFHHGQYMQTSISRPGLEEWEDNSGPMPSHITGVWMDKEVATAQQSAVNIGLSAGLAPKFAGYELVPLDLLDPSGGHGLGIGGRLVYRPDLLSRNQVGLSLAHNDIAVVPGTRPELLGLNDIRQVTVGLFADWYWEKWRLATNWVYFNMELKYSDSNVIDDFVLAYVQGEYEASERWTLFGRSEFGFNEDYSPYLRLLPAFVAHRHMLGVRWDFAESHALTFEAADTSTQGDDFMHDSFKELRLQWSGVFR